MIHNIYHGCFGLVTSFCPAWVILWHMVEKKKKHLSGIQLPVCRHEYNPSRTLICDDPKFRLSIFCLFFPPHLISLLFLFCVWVYALANANWNGKSHDRGHCLPIIISLFLTQAVQRSISNTGMFLNLNSKPFVPHFSVSLLCFHHVCLLGITLKPMFSGISF